MKLCKICWVCLTVLRASGCNKPFCSKLTVGFPLRLLLDQLAEAKCEREISKCNCGRFGGVCGWFLYVSRVLQSFKRRQQSHQPRFWLAEGLFPERQGVGWLESENTRWCCVISSGLLRLYHHVTPCHFHFTSETFVRPVLKVEKRSAWTPLPKFPSSPFCLPSSPPLLGPESNWRGQPSLSLCSSFSPSLWCRPLNAAGSSGECY